MNEFHKGHKIETIIALILCILAILLAGLCGYAELNKETLEEVEKLRWKHYGLNLTTDDILFYSDIKWNRDYSTLWAENGKLFIETQDGKWYIEMKEVIE